MDIEEFEDIFTSSGLFVDIRKTPAQKRQGFVPCNSLPRFRSKSSHLKVKTFMEANSSIHVDFYLYDKNLYASHNMEKLTMDILMYELDKALLHIPDYRNWKIIEIRDYKIKSLNL
jgi:hypothetical protein